MKSHDTPVQAILKCMRKIDPESTINVFAATVRLAKDRFPREGRVGILYNG